MERKWFRVVEHLVLCSYVGAGWDLAYSHRLEEGMLSPRALACLVPYPPQLVSSTAILMLASWMWWPPPWSPRLQSHN